MITSGIAPFRIPNFPWPTSSIAGPATFAALAEDAATLEECLRYRDLEQSYRLRAAEERVRQVSGLYAPNAGDSAA